MNNNLLNEEYISFLNSIADDIVDNMNSNPDIGDFEVCDLKFIQGNDKEVLAVFDFGHSPAGEDLSENDIFFDGTLNDLKHELYCFGESFDIDEHVSLWLGGRGAPSARELVEDAEAQQEFFSKLDYLLDCDLEKKIGTENYNRFSNGPSYNHEICRSR